MGENKISGNGNLSSYSLSPASAIRKLAFNRLVLGHFFLLFLISFVIGILFLHSMFTFSWQSEVVTTLDKVMEDLGLLEIDGQLAGYHLPKENMTLSHLLAR